MEKNLHTRIFTSMAVAATLGVASSAFATTITAWTFENNTVAVNNSPTPSTGTGTASSIGMDVYPTPNVGVTTDDVLVGKSSDTGANTLADTGQTWRVRAQAGANGAANGWSSLAPIGTQGGVFAASTAGFSSINVSFDFYTTNQGEANMALEYTTDGSTWTDLPITIPAADTGLSLLTNSTSSNTITGSYVQVAGGQNWFPNLTATISNPAAANDPKFAIEIVNASTGADDIGASGGGYNNNSGNWRFDNIVISGTAAPEPASLGVLAVGGLALLARRRK
jgi:hypothetical protein